MIPPRRRVWLYVPAPGQLELTMLGALDEIASMFAAVKSALERWHGFERVEIIGSGSTCGVLRATLTSRSTYTDAIAEALFAIREHVQLPRSFEWRGSSSDHPAGIVGIVGTW